MSASNPFFSIIIPVYNAEKYLDSCIHTVWDQTFADYEVILVDDGSTDRSAEMCDEFAASDIKIRAEHKKNGGQISARVHGMRLACGAYIVTLDADDGLRKDALEVVHDTILNFKADMVIFNFSKDRDFSRKGREIDLESNQVLKKEAIYDCIIRNQNLNNIWMKVYRREYADVSDQILSYSYVRLEEDLLQSLKPVTECQRPIYIDENLYYYRVNTESITQTFNEDCYQCTCDVSDVLRKCLVEWDLNTEEWNKKLSNRNLKLCVSVIRHYVLRCEDYDLAKAYLEQIGSEQFFKDAVENGEIRTLKRKDRVWIFLLKRKLYFLMKMYGCLIQIRHGSFK